MKKYILAAALVLASTSAMADRVVSDNSHTTSLSKMEACESAKYHAAEQKNNDEEVESYSRCDCEQDSRNKMWNCNASATLEKKN